MYQEGVGLLVGAERRQEKKGTKEEIVEESNGA
jgi:hypothetical protein